MTFGVFEFVHLWIKNANQPHTQNMKLIIVLFGGKISLEVAFLGFCIREKSLLPAFSFHQHRPVLDFFFFKLLSKFFLLLKEILEMTEGSLNRDRNRYF